MAFQMPITIATTLERVQKLEYVLPAIQREFVWNDDQICRLFDSLMRGYPIGSLLFWRVEPDNISEFAYYGFIRDYHERDARHLPRLDVSDHAPITAILDGQQRLTSLNIGLRGSHAKRVKYGSVNNPLAYPKRYLYLNIAEQAFENELGMEYDFRFIPPERIENSASSDAHWFRVSKITTFNDASDIFEYIQQHDLATNKTAFRMLNRLHAVVTAERVINYFEETAQDLDKVPNIFIRVNSGGTVLSYSDLLLSIATAQWKEVDARDAVHQLVDDLNDTGQGFRFSKDIVLKSGLMLSDLPSIAFRVTNFNASNMAKLQDNWPTISMALRLGVRLLADFGFSERTLTADSVLIPLAYYLNYREASEQYLTSKAYADDRERIRGWVVRSLVKSGVWGSGLDQLLLTLRTVIRDSGTREFPVTAAEAAMTRLGKSLRFEEEEIQELAQMSFGDRRVFPVLSLLYRGMNFQQEFHVDHIFPRSLCTRAQLNAAGIDQPTAYLISDHVNRLPNLQLLEGPVNTSKNAKMPMQWLHEHLSEEVARDYYRARHDLGVVPESIADFEQFYDARRQRIADRLRRLLNVASSAPAGAVTSSNDA